MLSIHVEHPSGLRFGDGTPTYHRDDFRWIQQYVPFILVLMHADKIASHEFHRLQEMPQRVQTGPILQF